MFTVSQNFKDLMASNDRTFQLKVLINGTAEYLDDVLYEMVINSSMIGSDEVKLGEVISSKLNLTIKTDDTIPLNASIEPFIKVKNDLVESEWVPLGTFYIDTRVFQKGVWKLECYDKLMFTNQLFVSALTYPNTMQAVFNEIVGQLGVVVDASVSINPSYQIPYKDEDMIMRDMLSYIAISSGASVKMTKDNKLAFINLRPIDVMATYPSIDASDYANFEQLNTLKTFTKLDVTINSDGEVISKGTGTPENTLTAYSPFVDDAMVNSILGVTNGFSFTPMNMKWKSRIYIEPGDYVKVKDMDNVEHLVVILSSTISFKGGVLETSISPGASPLSSEFQYKGSLRKMIPTSGLQEDVPYYGVIVGRANGLKIAKSDASSELILNSDVMKWKAKNALGQLVDRLYIDAVTGEMVFNGKFGVEAISAMEAEIDVVISNTFITQTLAAEKGNIAELTVDQLDTSTKVQKYLANDPTPVDYIKAYGQNIDFIEATTDGLSTVQLTDRFGNNIFWLDETHVGTTLETTDYPVTIYDYTEITKLRIYYEDINGVNTPIIEMGAGDGVTPVSGKARIVKDSNSLDIMFFKPNTGEEVLISLSANGIIQKGGTGYTSLRNISVGTVAPTNPQMHDLWIDTNV